MYSEANGWIRWNHTFATAKLLVGVCSGGRGRTNRRKKRKKGRQNSCNVDLCDCHHIVSQSHFLICKIRSPLPPSPRTCPPPPMFPPSSHTYVAPSSLYMCAPSPLHICCPSPQHICCPLPSYICSPLPPSSTLFLVLSCWYNLHCMCKTRES